LETEGFGGRLGVVEGTGRQWFAAWRKRNPLIQKKKVELEKERGENPLFLQKKENQICWGKRKKGPLYWGERPAVEKKKRDDIDIDVLPEKTSTLTPKKKKDDFTEGSEGLAFATKERTPNGGGEGASNASGGKASCPQPRGGGGGDVGAQGSAY